MNKGDRERRRNNTIERAEECLMVITMLFIITTLGIASFVFIVSLFATATKS